MNQGNIFNESHFPILKLAIRMFAFLLNCCLNNNYHLKIGWILKANGYFKKYYSSNKHCLQIWKSEKKYIYKLIQLDFEACRCVFYTVEWLQSFNFSQMMNNLFEKSKSLNVKGFINALNNYLCSVLCSNNQSKWRHHYFG